MVPVLFLILLAGIIGTQDAFAVTKTYVGGDNTDWENANNWEPHGVPNQNDDIQIKAPGALRVNIHSDVTIGPSGSITTDLGSVIRAVSPGSLTIQGTYTMNNIADALVARGGTIVNDVTGIITLSGGLMFTQTFSGNGGTIINHGTITGTRQGGSTPQDNSIFLLSGGHFQNSGICTSSIKVLTGSTFEGIPCVSGNNNFNPTHETEFLIREIDDVIVPYGRTPVEEKLLDALDKLDTALEELKKSPPDNEAAVGNLEGAVGEIEAAIDEGLNVSDGTQLMDQLAEISRQLAVAAIDFALNQPNADQGQISDAQDFLAEGDMLRDSGDFKDAVNNYKDALEEAEDALD